jgi:hypothetical protein
LARRLKALVPTAGTIDGELRQRIGLDAPAAVQVLDRTPAPAADDGGEQVRPARVSIPPAFWLGVPHAQKPCPGVGE